MKSENQTKMEVSNRIKDIFKAEKKLRAENAKFYLSVAKTATSLVERNRYDSQAWIEGVKVYALLNDLEKRILKAIKS